MKLSYIFHSGFVLETEQSILVFDYWLDPSGVMDSSSLCTSLQALNRASSESRAELVRTMPSRERGRAELNPLGV